MIRNLFYDFIRHDCTLFPVQILVVNEPDDLVEVKDDIINFKNY